MLITNGQAKLVSHPVRSSDGDAFWAGGSGASTVDGRPGLPGALVWSETGASATDFATAVFEITPVPVTGRPPRLFALLDTRELRVGTRVELVGGIGDNPTSVIAQTTLKRLPNGKVGTWLYLPTQSNLFAYWGWRIYNDDGDGAYLLPGSTVYVGEVFADAVESWPAASMKIDLVDPTSVNRSAGNQPWPTMRRPYRKADVTVTAQHFDRAFIDQTGNLQALQYALATAHYFAIVPRERERGSASASDDYVQRMAMLVRCTSLGDLSADASRDAYSLQLSLEELL
ncbi:MAG TPA: hypothetical protein VJ724_07350 [Tahibacter sp.]|nr:hypothetical protein [Tahibacter sp.]